MGFFDNFFSNNKKLNKEKVNNDIFYFTEKDLENIQDSEELQFFKQNYINKNKVIKIFNDNTNNNRYIAKDEKDNVYKMLDDYIKILSPNSPNYNDLWTDDTILPNRIRCSNDGKYIAISYIGTQPTYEIEMDEDGYSDICYLPHSYNSFILFNNEKSNIVKYINNSDILDFYISNDSKYLAIAKKDRSAEGDYTKDNNIIIEIILLSEMKVIGNIELDDNEFCFGVAINPSSQSIAVGISIGNDWSPDADHYEAYKLYEYKINHTYEEYEKKYEEYEKKYEEYKDNNLCKIKIYNIETFEIQNEISFCYNISAHSYMRERYLEHTVKNEVKNIKIDYSYDGNYIICSLYNNNEDKDCMDLYIFNSTRNTLEFKLDNCDSFDIDENHNRIAVSRYAKYSIIDLDTKNTIYIDKYCIGNQSIKFNSDGTKIIVRGTKCWTGIYGKRYISIYNIVGEMLRLDKIYIYDEYYFSDDFLELTSNDELLLSYKDNIYIYDIYNHKCKGKIKRLFSEYTTYEYSKSTGYIIGGISGGPIAKNYSAFKDKIIGTVNMDTYLRDNIVAINTKSQYLHETDNIIDKFISQNSNKVSSRPSGTKNSYGFDDRSNWDNRDWNEFLSGDPDIDVDISDYYSDFYGDD